MKILRKMFTADKEWVDNTMAELERNKIRDKKLKKLNLHDRMVAQTMWDDTDEAGRARYRRNQAVSGLVGGLVGGGLGNVAANVAGTNGGRKKLAATVGGALVGRGAARLMTNKKNRRIMEKIWDKGDKEQMDYIEADSKKKKQLEKDYKPIGWRVDRKGEYWKEKGQEDVPYYGESLSDRVKVREAYVKAINSLDENKRSTKKTQKVKKKDSNKKNN